MTVKEFLIKSRLTDDCDWIQATIEKLPKPYVVGEVHTPSTMNDLNIGELMQLQEISNEQEMLFVPCRVILGMEESEVLKADVNEVLGFVYWVAKEVERINKLFASTNVPPTPEEKLAGVDRLNFGPFGLLDYFALRMGISDHEEVEKVPWIRVYKCLEIDAGRIRFERRLRNILREKK